MTGKIRGRTFTNIKEVENSVKKGAGGEVVGVKDQGMNVRFLSEPTGWVEYFQHWDDIEKAYKPCVEGCEYCADGDTPSKRYLTNVVNLDDNNKVVCLSITKSTAQQLMRQYRNNKTILDRDFTITREGTGMNDTEYTVTPEAPRKMALSRYKPLDLWAILERMGGDGADEEDDEDEVEEPRRVVKRSVRRESASTPMRKATRTAEPRKAVRRVVEPPKRIAKKATPAKRVAKRAR